MWPVECLCGCLTELEGWKRSEIESWSSVRVSRLSNLSWSFIWNYGSSSLYKNWKADTFQFWGLSKVQPVWCQKVRRILDDFWRCWQLQAVPQIHPPRTKQSQVRRHYTRDVYVHKAPVDALPMPNLGAFPTRRFIQNARHQDNGMSGDLRSRILFHLVGRLPQLYVPTQLVVRK